MTRLPALLRTAAVLGAALTVAVAAPGPAQAGHPTRLQPFLADSGDNCRYGYTQGTLAFHAVHPPELPAVSLSGTVVDRPVPTDPVACRDDRRTTTASFTAYAGNAPVDAETRTVDNGTLDFRFVLGDDPRVTQIDRVVVQVCRSPLWGITAPTYCGKPQAYGP